MEFLKKLGKSLFGLSRSSAPQKTKAKKPKKKSKKIEVKKKKISNKKKTSSRKTIAPIKRRKMKRKVAANGKKQPALVKNALAALPAAEVTHYFPKVNAAVLKIRVGDIRIGDTLQFKGHSTEFAQKVSSMQIDHKPILIAKKGDDFGIEVQSRVRAGDLVYKK